MIKKKIKINEKVFDVELEPIKEKYFRVEINGKDYFFKRDGGDLVPIEASHILAEEEDQMNGEVQMGGGAQRNVKAPLSGTVSSVWVKAGDSVSKNQKLVTIIAMKMENEISAVGSGRVKEIKCAANQNVNKDDTLIIFE